MHNDPGTLSLARCGGISLTIAEETYQLTRNDIHTLLFYGQSVPLSRTEETVCPGGAVMITSVIDGHIAVHASGRAVLVVTRAGYFAVPFTSFQQVARGEAVSCPIFPVVPDNDTCTQGFGGLA